MLVNVTAVTRYHSWRLKIAVLHVYLHCEPHSSGPFDMQLVYEDMPQESGSYQYRVAHISANG